MIADSGYRQSERTVAGGSDETIILMGIVSIEGLIYGISASGCYHRRGTYVTEVDSVARIAVDGINKFAPSEIICNLVRSVSVVPICRI